MCALLADVSKQTKAIVIIIIQHNTMINIFAVHVPMD